MKITDETTRYIEGNYDDGTQTLVHNIESSFYPGFVIPREFIRSLLGRIKGTRHIVRYTEKFVISEVRYFGIPLFLQTKKQHRITTYRNTNFR